MLHWVHDLSSKLHSESPAVLVTIEEIRGSTPREVGTSMLVLLEQFYGTIGGGNLEYQALKLAREQLVKTTPDQIHRFPLSASLGQCCGGWVSLSLKTITPSEQWRADYLKQQESLATRFPVLLFGAGHVGTALVNVLKNLPCDVTWVDEREECFPKTVAANINVICHDDPIAEVDDAPEDSRCLILTHSHALDFELVRAGLSRNFPYLGLIGSQSKRNSFKQRFKRRGMTEKEFSKLICPIGISGIEDKTPEVIAVSVAAELLLYQKCETKQSKSTTL